MAVFCNNKLCEFDDCTMKLRDGIVTIPSDYVGDFSSSCQRITQYTAKILTDGTWKEIFKRKLGYEDHQDAGS